MNGVFQVQWFREEEAAMKGWASLRHQTRRVGWLLLPYTILRPLTGCRIQSIRSCWRLFAIPGHDVSQECRPVSPALLTSTQRLNFSSWGITVYYSSSCGHFLSELCVEFEHSRMQWVSIGTRVLGMQRVFSWQ